MDLNLKGKAALIAGGTRGIGFGIAEALAAEGARCSIGGRSVDSAAESSADLRQRFGVEVLGSALNVSDGASIERWVGESADRFGGIDLLVVNSGGPRPGTFVDLDDTSWIAAFNLLLLGAVRLIRLALPYLEASSAASIVVISSTSIRQPVDNLLLSNAIRPAVAALAKCLSLEFAERGIRVNTIMPGRIATDRLIELDGANAALAGISIEQQREKIIRTIPLGRYGKVSEIAALAAFLLSPQASYITGGTFGVDGGSIRSW